MIKVRFAPSPTGYLHIGGARTALFNWLYARAQNGTFVLRVEDTDLTRSKPEFIDEILKGLTWLGLDWDEFYKQSDRFDLYRASAEKLLSEGKAYCDGPAVILKVPREPVKIYDLIRGEIDFDTELLKDEVLMKSDGSPTYSFACVVDDADMGITHVIRGEDHISNTPKQVLIYQALGIKPPKFAHLPLIMADDGTRMSKRNGAVAVSDYEQMGVLPEALVNYLLLLGWSPGGNQEIISLDAAVKKFSLKKVNRSAAAFALDKLTWVNQEYVKVADSQRLAELAKPFLQKKFEIDDNSDGQTLLNIVKLYKRRLPTLADVVDRAGYVFSDTVVFEQAARDKYLNRDLSREFGVLKERLARVADFEQKNVEAAFRSAVDELGVDAATLVHPVRVALTGTDVGIGLFETMELLGKDKTVARLSLAFQE